MLDGGTGDSLLVASPEDELIAQQHSKVLDVIYDELQADEEALLVLMGWGEGHRGRALRDATGLNQAQLDYAVKRIRKTARRLYPNGWNL